MGFNLISDQLKNDSNQSKWIFCVLCVKFMCFCDVSINNESVTNRMDSISNVFMLIRWPDNHSSRTLIRMNDYLCSNWDLCGKFFQFILIRSISILKFSEIWIIKTIEFFVRLCIVQTPISKLTLTQNVSQVYFCKVTFYRMRPASPFLNILRYVCLCVTSF